MSRHPVGSSIMVSGFNEFCSLSQKEQKTKQNARQAFFKTWDCPRRQPMLRSHVVLLAAVHLQDQEWGCLCGCTPSAAPGKHVLALGSMAEFPCHVTFFASNLCESWKPAKQKWLQVVLPLLFSHATVGCQPAGNCCSLSSVWLWRKRVGSRRRAVIV